MKRNPLGKISFKAKIFADGQPIDKIDASSFSDFEMKLRERGKKYS